MRYRELLSLTFIPTVLLAACGIPQPSNKVPVSASSLTVTFFANVPKPNVELTLRPDPFVMREMPNVTPPNTQVEVYLPTYPGSTSTTPVSGIGDMGTSMDGDLVDGTVYFKSKDSQARIKAWYTQRLRKLGYTITGQGTLADHGKTTSAYFDFTKNGQPGDPARNPDINLGFLSQNQSGETVFKLKASYIVTPPRPKDSYLPTDIIKVVLKKGKITKTITDKKWIADIVRMINTLQVSTPGMSGGSTATNDVSTKIHAAFYEGNNSVINVTYSILSATITIGNTNVALSSGPSPELNKDLESVFGD